MCRIVSVTLSSMASLRTRIDVGGGRQVGTIAGNRDGGGSRRVSEQLADCRRGERRDGLGMEPVGLRKLRKQRGVERVASATAARRIGTSRPCQSPSGAMACAISGALRDLPPERDNAWRMASSRGSAVEVESGEDMRLALAHSLSARKAACFGTASPGVLIACIKPWQRQRSS